MKKLLFFVLGLFLVGLLFSCSYLEKEEARMNSVLILNDDEVEYWKLIVLESKGRPRNSAVYADSIIIELRKRTGKEL